MHRYFYCSPLCIPMHIYTMASATTHARMYESARACLKIFLNEEEKGTKIACLFCLNKRMVLFTRYES